MSTSTSVRISRTPSTSGEVGVAEELRLLGVMQHAGGHWEFDYPPHEALREVSVTASVPDARAHEFRETPADLARECVDEADIGPHDLCLEPSAGRGAIAQMMPAERTTCVELAPVFARLLTARGLDVVQDDSVTSARTTERRFSRVAMNPPSSRGQALEQLRAAAALPRPGGRLVAVLPDSLLRNEAPVPDMHQRWVGAVRCGLATTGAHVCVVVLDGPAAKKGARPGPKASWRPGRRTPGAGRGAAKRPTRAGVA